MADTRSNEPIVITGGARRLGLAAALALHEANYRVAVTFRATRPSLAMLQDKGIETIPADLGTESGVMQLAGELHDRYQSLRGLIHNASEWLPEGADHSDSAVLQRMFGIHVMAPYLLNQECGELLRRHGQLCGQADIIHMSDYVASTGSKKHIAYAASKAALDNLTLSFASKFAPFVKVNSIAPALLMFQQNDDEAYRQKALQKSLLGIEPGAAEGVNAIRYLLDSRYLTGKTIALDGGRHLARAS